MQCIRLEEGKRIEAVELYNRLIRVEHSHGRLLICYQDVHHKFPTLVASTVPVEWFELRRGHLFYDTSYVQHVGDANLLCLTQDGKLMMGDTELLMS